MSSRPRLRISSNVFAPDQVAIEKTPLGATAGPSQDGVDEARLDEARPTSSTRRICVSCVFLDPARIFKREPHLAGLGFARP